MSKGAKIKLILPPDWGYGKKGLKKLIPPNATLTFMIKLYDFKEKDTPFDKNKLKFPIKQSS